VGQPVDPGNHWLEAGITGLARQREWDAVATVEAPGAPGDEAEFVALADGRVLVDAGPAGFDCEPLAAALEGSIERPYRALALRRPELWTIGARSIAVAELQRDPDGDVLELVRTADGVTLQIDGLPSLTHMPELEELGAARFPTFVVRVQRLEGKLFEVEVEPL
jgi:hypothetical protein